MKVNSIGYNYAAPAFTGQNNKVNKKNNNNIIIVKPDGSDKFNKALKTILISALMASPSAINTSCDKITDTDYSHWENENPKHYKDYLYTIPSRQIDNIKLPADSVVIKDGSAANENLNKNLNKMLNVLNIPRMTTGELPVSMSWLSDGSSKSVMHMVLDGESVQGGNYVYNVSKYSADGSKKSYKYTLSDDGDKINFKVSGSGSNSEFTLSVNGNEVECHEKINGKNHKTAVFCESKLPDLTGKKAHCLVKEAFDENGETTDLNVMSKFDLWSYTPDNY